MKKIIYICDSFPPESIGGAAIIVDQLASNISKYFETFVITTSAESKKTVLLRKKWGVLIKIARQGNNQKYRFLKTLFLNREAKELIKVFLRIDPDIVHFHNIHEHFSYALLKKIRHLKPNIKMFITAHDGMSISYGKLSNIDEKIGVDKPAKISFLTNIKIAGFSWVPFRSFFIKKFLSYVDKVVVVSASLEKQLKYNGITKTFVIHNGLSSIDTSESLPKRMREILAKKKNWITFSGRVSRAKGVYNLIEAFKEIKRKSSNIGLLIIGEETSGLKNAIQSNHLENDIYCTGWLDYKIARLLINGNDVCVVPSLYIDPFPTVVIEAAASKCPLVVSSFGGAKEVIINNKSGFIVNPYNINELAEKVFELIHNKKKAQLFSKNAFLRFKKSFSTEQFINKHLKLYNAKF